MKMTKEKAHEILNKYLKYNFGNDNDKLNRIPIFDAVVYTKTVDGNILEQYTFRGLLKIAYDLHESLEHQLFSNP